VRRRPNIRKARDGDGHDRTRPRDGDRQAGLFDIEMPNVDGLAARIVEQQSLLEPKRKRAATN
jgi:hypothetical protein